MLKVNSKKHEALRISFSRRNFDSDEIEEITKCFSKIVPVEHSLYVRKVMSDAILPPLVIFFIGFALGGVAEVFFKAMGSDLYRKAKKKVIQRLKKKENATLKFVMSYKDTKILVESQTNDERELNEIFDTINKARDIAVKELDRKGSPEMNIMLIHYDNGWVLDSGHYLKGPHPIFYKYNKKTGKWESTEEA